LNVLRVVVILLRIYGGQVECQPVQPPVCTLFVSGSLAIDVRQTPEGEIVIARWNPGTFVIGDK
jgi:hypothetical protein